jgi:glycerophosphoryl diester phosphodiesterase
MAIAHRGDPVNERENTLVAFESAVRAGAEMIELDLQRTCDNEIVVVHDPTLSRLWNVDAAVADLELVAVLGTGTGDLRVPTLREVLLKVPRPLMIDFTGPAVLPRTVELVRTSSAMETSLFVSGDLDALRTLRALAPEARIGVTWSAPDPPDIALLEDLRAEFWNPVFAVVSADSVTSMHAHGFKVSTWTVDEPDDMARLADFGVDAIVTNRIADLLAVLAVPGPAEV